MKLSVTLASLVYLAPTLIQAFPLSHEDGSIDVRDAPEALHHQLPRHRDAEPGDESSEEQSSHLIYEKERRDAEFSHESPYDVSNAHGEELMIERDAIPTVNTEANDYPHYPNYDGNNKIQHSGHQNLHKGSHRSLHLDEDFQGDTHFSYGGTDPAEARDLDSPVGVQHVAEQEVGGPVKSGHEERDVEDTSHHTHAGMAAHAEKESHIKMSHYTTHPHKAKATHFIHGEKDQAKPHNPHFQANLHKIAAVQGKVPVKPARPVVEPTGVAPKHHRQAREAAPAVTQSHPYHYEGTPIPLASKTALQEKVASILEHEFPQYSAKIEKHLKALEGHGQHMITKREAGPVAKATPTPTTHLHENGVHNHMHAHLPKASRTVLEAQVASVLEHDYPKYSAKIEQHLKVLQAHHKQHHSISQSTGHSSDHSKREIGAEFGDMSHEAVQTPVTYTQLSEASIVAFEKQVDAALQKELSQFPAGIPPQPSRLTGEPVDEKEAVESFPKATPPPVLEERQLLGRSHARKEAHHPVSYATLPEASRSILNEEIASILEEEYPQYSAKIAAHMKAYKAKHTGTPGAYQAGIPVLAQPAMKHEGVAKAYQTGLPKRQLGELMEEDGIFAHHGHLSSTTTSYHETSVSRLQHFPTHTLTHPQFRGFRPSGTSFEGNPISTGLARRDEDDSPVFAPASKLSQWEEYLLNATLHHQLFGQMAPAKAAPAEAASPNSLHAGKVEARDIGSKTDYSDSTATSQDFGHFGYTPAPVANDVMFDEASPKPTTSDFHGNISAPEDMVDHPDTIHVHKVVPVHHNSNGTGNKASHEKAVHHALKNTNPRIKELAHEALQGSATVSGGYHVASASGVVVSALETQLPVGPNGKNEDMLELDITMPVADVGELSPMMPGHTGTGGILQSPPDEYGEIPRFSHHPRPIGQSSTPGWLSELVAEDRAAVKSVDPQIPLPTGSLQQQLAAFNVLEATVSRDSPLATNTHLAEQLSANNGLMYGGASAPHSMTGQLDPLADYGIPNSHRPYLTTASKIGKSSASVENAAPGTGAAIDGASNQLSSTGQLGASADYGAPIVNAPAYGTPPKTGQSPSSNENTAPGTGAAFDETLPSLGGQNHSEITAATPLANEAGGDMSQGPAVAGKPPLSDTNNAPVEHVKRNLWDILGVTDDV
ncbi:hypothetical protein MMC11_008577 [Xylographa trunciseda]|nr:hypothetical protein [Xylographa trunciseda]